MSSNNNFMSREFWKTAKGQRTFCALGIAASLLFLLWQFGGEFSLMMPGSDSSETLKREIKKYDQDIAKVKASMSEIDAVRKIADSKLDGAWTQSVNGVPEVELRTLIEKAAKTLELRLNNISTVRKSSFNSDMSILEVDVALTSDIDTLSRFLLAVDKITPKLYWKRFECRTSNRFGMSGVQFNGTLRCANDERPAALKAVEAAGKAEKSKEKSK